MHGVDLTKAFTFMAQATCKVMVEAPKTDRMPNQTIAAMRHFSIASGVADSGWSSFNASGHHGLVAPNSDSPFTDKSARPWLANVVLIGL